ncbi:MAG: hypothetical protein QXG63_05785 [Nitrososphaerales archaeon]
MQWQKYQEIAKRFEHKAKREDREDLRQDIILRLAEVEARYNGNGGSLSEAAMLRVASYVVMEYWHNIKRKPTMLSLNDELEDGDGNTIELYQIIADDRAIDLDAWFDARRWLLGCPKRLVSIAYKRAIGEPLDGKDQDYLEHHRRKELRKYQQKLAVF